MKKFPIQWIIVVLIIVVVTWLFGCDEIKPPNDNIGYNKPKSEWVKEKILNQTPLLDTIIILGEKQLYRIRYKEFELNIIHSDFVEYRTEGFWEFSAFYKDGRPLLIDKKMLSSEHRLSEECYSLLIDLCLKQGAFRE
jgi:hypothetical protein